jgi:hypothetical protein
MEMLDMLIEACKIAYGEEWETFTAKEQRDIIMSFIYTAAQNSK